MTRFFRHYKNKPYKYLGEAKHSETLEDFVIYETLYKNELSTLWVRPKEMFFEDVTVAGQQIPRFAPVVFEIQRIETVTLEQKNRIAPLIVEVFGQVKSSKFDAILRNYNNFLLQCALEGSQLVGFKIGYQHDDETFYSWMGAVSPSYRGLGIASLLMKDQHDWCRMKGFKRIQTKTQNRWRDMIALNLRYGFHIVGAYTDGSGKPKLILEKVLSEFEQSSNRVTLA